MKTRKLTRLQVIEIRRTYFKRPSRRALAEKFGVSPGLINSVLKGDCYKDCGPCESGKQTKLKLFPSDKGPRE